MKYRPPPVPLLSVGLEMCDLDRPRGDAALPSSPSAEPRTRKGKSSGPCRPRRASHHGGVGQRAALRRPPASARRGARIAGGAGACWARGALHLSACLAVATTRCSRTGLRLSHPRCERWLLLIYGQSGSGKEAPPTKT